MKFTPLELRELGEMRDVDMIVYDEDFDYDDASRAAIASNKQVMVIDRVLQSWRKRAVGQRLRRGRSRTSGHPAACTCTSTPSRSRSSRTTAGASSAFRWERTRPDGEGGVVGTGEIREVAIQAIYRAVGYFGSPLPGVPFDQRHGVIPNHEGQVLQRRLERARVRRLRDGLDQARSGRPDRPHQVRRHGDRSATSSTTRARGGSRPTRRRRRSPRCSSRAA